MQNLEVEIDNPEPVQTKKGDLTMGRWTHQEHARFLYCKYFFNFYLVNLALNKFGKDWKRI